MRRNEAYLLDILIAARRAMSYMEGSSREEFQQNEMLQDAVAPHWKLSEKLPAAFRMNIVKRILKFPGIK